MMIITYLSDGSCDAERILLTTGIIIKQLKTINWVDNTFLAQVTL